MSDATATMIPAVLERVNEFELVSTYRFEARVTVKVKNLVQEIKIDSQRILADDLFKKMESFGFSPDWTALKAEYDVWAKDQENQENARITLEKIKTYDSSWIHEAIKTLNAAGYQANPNFSKDQYINSDGVQESLTNMLYVKVQKEGISFDIYKETRGKFHNKMVIYTNEYFRSKIWSKDLLKAAEKIYAHKLAEKNKTEREQAAKIEASNNFENLQKEICYRYDQQPDVKEIKTDKEYGRYSTTNVVRVIFNNGLIVNFTGTHDKISVYSISHPKMNTLDMVEILRKVHLV